MLVSIVIPSYNHSKFIVECINSVLNQKHKEFELIVVDDGSVDNSVELISGFKDERIRLYAQENQGAHAAINRGLSLANGELLTVLNSDDAYAPERISEIVECFAQTNVDFVSTWIQIIDSGSKRLGVKEGWRNMLPWEINDLNKSYYTTGDYALNALMTNFVSTTSNMFFTRAVYETIGGMRNLRFTHDWDFLLRVINAGFQCKEIPSPLLSYRLHGDNTITKSRKWMMFEICWTFAANVTGNIGKELFSSNDSSSAHKQFEMFYNSMNFQGNDKGVWTLLIMFNSLRDNGVINPEEKILDDDKLREFVIDTMV